MIGRIKHRIGAHILPPERRNLSWLGKLCDWVALPAVLAHFAPTQAGTALLIAA
jgi:hypothetical protein